MATALREFETTREARRAISTNGHRTPRVSPLAAIARWLATHLPEATTVRTVILNLLAAVCLLYGIFLLAGLGWALVAVAPVALVCDWWLNAQAETP